ncbi:hypothetical protein [Phenylobacterium sp.]|nr:hypothetical protein [Phenylobacterium sp.]
MTAYVPANPQPLRRDLTDPRSSGPSTPRGAAPPLNDSRSTGGGRSGR